MGKFGVLCTFAFFFARNLLRLYDSYMNVSLNLRLVKSKEFLKNLVKKCFCFPLYSI